MKVWLIRAGKDGEYESEARGRGRVAIGFGRSLPDLSSEGDLESIRREYASANKWADPSRVGRSSGQIYRFVNAACEEDGVVDGDVVIMPLKEMPSVAVGRVTGGCRFDGAAEEFRHYRPVKWLATIPKAVIPWSVRGSFSAQMTLSRIRGDNAEEDMEKLISAHAGAAVRGVPDDVLPDGPQDHDPGRDLVADSRNTILRHLERWHMGHSLEDLVGAILRAKGYTVQVSPKGGDGGIDIVAGHGSTGMDEPRICVQVKSSRYPVPRDEIDKLEKAAAEVNATHRLLVAWSGVEGCNKMDKTRSYFTTRVWTQDDVVDELVSVYDDLDDEFRARIPLRRLWAVVEEPDC
ncbi:MAG: restriction endonuclease [Nitrosopumilus sp.]|nr:restriction endonuclease [Nitrosopumilus sp.]MDA7957852.1 restriction endonuclease [Nitrosopumilus sp.]